MVSDPSQSQGLLASSTAPGFRQDEGLHAVHNNAWDAPQVHDPASEGLQSVDYDGRNGPQALDHPASSPEVAYAHYGDHNAEKAGVTIVSAGDVAQSRPSRRRKWTWIIAIAVVLVIAIAVGVGAGVGLSRKSSGSEKGSSAKDAESTSASVVSATTSPPTTETPTATTTTSAPVTSGTSGIADFKCDDFQLTISDKGNAYVQDCGVYYRTNENMLAPDPKSWVRNLPIGANGKSLDPVTKYSFKDCIDHCDEYNSNRNSTDQACYAVSYYANLDWVFKRWPGNCFLKNGLGNGTSTGDGTEDWEHTASAYKFCLNGDNGCA